MLNVKRGAKFVAAVAAVFVLILVVGWLKANAPDLLSWLLMVVVLAAAFILGATKD